MPFSETDISLLRVNVLLQGLPEFGQFEAAIRRPENQLCLPTGSQFLTAGERSPGLHFVVHGTIELVAASDGAEKIVDFARAGGVLGEETMFDGQPLRYSARTLTPAAILRVPEGTVDEWVATSPTFARRFMGFLAERTDYLQKDLVTFCTKNATARLVCYLVCHFDHAPRTPDGTLSLSINLPRSKLASRIGISHSHLSRAFRELEDAGLIQRTPSGMFIPDVPALSKYVCPAGCDW